MTVCVAAFALSCAHAIAGWPPFAGPGRLLIILERKDGAREIRVIDAQGVHPVRVDAPREARFVHPGTLLVLRELPATQEYGLPETQLLLVDLASSAQEPLGAPGRYYDPAPSPDGRWLAVGVDTPDVGDSDLEIWSLDGRREHVATRHQSFEEPRWRRDGRALAASLLMADPETDDDTGGGMLGTSFTWPRLYRLRRDLSGPTLLWDGDDSQSLAPGGSLALWWDERGIFARQRRGLVRCDATRGGCATVFAPDGGRRVADGCPIGAGEALLLTLPAHDAFDRVQADEILRIDLESGAVAARWHAPRGLAVVGIDWIGPGAQ